VQNRSSNLFLMERASPSGFPIVARDGPTDTAGTGSGASEARVVA
jgi:hypothetical protein